MAADRVSNFISEAGQIASATGSLAKFREDLQALIQGRMTLEQFKVKWELEKESTDRAVRELQEWGKSVTASMGTALWDAFEKGESISKAWAKISADFFRREFEKVMDSLGTALGDLFDSIGLGEGVGGALTGLLGLAGAIYNKMESKSTSTIEDFSEAINSSEAVRGVVAGPTNVAISKVGDSLKQALRTSEILLERIAIAVESGGGGGGGGVGPGAPELGGNAALPLTTTSPT